MRDYLNGRPEIFTSSFAVQNIPVDSSGGEIRELIQILVDESLIMSEIQIGLRSVIRNINLTMLVRAHGSGIDIDIRVELLGSDLKSSCLEKPSE